MVVNGKEGDYTCEELQTVIDRNEAVIDELTEKVEALKKEAESEKGTGRMWYESYCGQLNRVSALEGDLKIIKDIVNRLAGK